MPGCLRPRAPAAASCPEGDGGLSVPRGTPLRLAWNLSTVISFDVGVSREHQVFCMELGTQL